MALGKWDDGPPVMGEWDGLILRQHTASHLIFLDRPKNMRMTFAAKEDNEVDELPISKGHPWPHT